MIVHEQNYHVIFGRRRRLRRRAGQMTGLLGGHQVLIVCENIFVRRGAILSSAKISSAPSRSMPVSKMPTPVSGFPKPVFPRRFCDRAAIPARRRSSREVELTTLSLFNAKAEMPPARNAAGECSVMFGRQATHLGECNQISEQARREQPIVSLDRQQNSPAQ